MKSALHVLGYLLVLSAFFRIIPIAVGLFYGEAVLGFVLTMVLSLFLGTLLIYLARLGDGKTLKLEPQEAMVVVAVSFIVIPAVGAISFLPYVEMNYIDALFESVSGFTTTGLSIFTSLEGVPRSIIIWRSLTQWLGGLGIIVIFLFIFSHFSAHNVYAGQQRVSTGKSLYSTLGYPQDMGTSLVSSVKRILFLYLMMTLLGISIMVISGINFFDSVSLTFSSISTGGFSSSHSFNYLGHQLIGISIVMVLGALPFNLYSRLMWDRKIVKNTEVKFFFFIILFFILIGFLMVEDAAIAFFQVISALTTTGFSIEEISAHQGDFLFLLLIAMFMGGCTSSTAGGVKQIRIILMLKSVPWAIKQLTSPPTQIINFKYGGKVLGEKEVLLAQTFVILNIMVIAAGTLLLVTLGYSQLDSLFVVISALGTVGMSTIPLYDMPVVGKIILITGMLLGRIEYFPVLLLIRSILRKE